MLMARETTPPPSRLGKVSITIWTDDDRRRRLRVLAAETGRSIQEIVEEALDRELARGRKK
jgi:predicted transcriptional regulator